jgi:hypothetical protein
MQNPRRELSDIVLPRALIVTSAMTCGVLAALALQMYLGRAGFDLASLWENLSSAGARQLRTAGPWWALAGIAFITSGIIAGALSRLPLPWRRFRLLRWATGAVILLLLAHIGHSVAEPAVGAGADLAVRLAALIVAGLMALLGAYFAIRR